MDAVSSPSAALLEAQTKLLQLRSEIQARRKAAGLPVDRARQPSNAPPWTPSKPATLTDSITTLPDHLGWDSERFTAVLRSRQQRQAEATRRAQSPKLTWISKPASIACARLSSPTPPEILSTTSPGDATVKLYHDLTLGMLRNELAAPGRIWLLLRYIDVDGRGWVTVDQARTLLTRKDSPLRVVGWRQLRNLLRAGQGIFWERGSERIWLRSVAKVATQLDVKRLTGRPVALPVSSLLQGMGEVKAHFYASFHSGRKRNNPINRDKLEEISGVPARTQRAYEKAAGVGSQRNIAVGEKYSKENVQKRAWIHGNAVFDFIDHHGRQGPEKRHYVAWHLPNSYEGCHQHSPRGRMKKINREIDLVKQRARGNGLSERLFHTNGADAVKGHSRNADVDVYWPGTKGQRKPKGLWYVLPSYAW